MDLETMTTFTSEDREWAYWNTYDCPKYTRQTEIQFFFPLTEQIPLELNYTGCDTKKNEYNYSGVSSNNGTGIFISPYPTTWTTSINVDTNNVTITSKNKPPLYRRILYKLLGINWKQS
jgi:hypothetical protein